MVATARVTPIATTTEAIAQLVTAAALDGACLILTYVNAEGAVTARGVWPVLTQRHPTEPLWVSKAGERCFSGFDSLRDAVITYRLDRVIDGHRLEA
jgi:predicted DNA-binding transcriptional regulator YafY